MIIAQPLLACVLTLIQMMHLTGLAEPTHPAARNAADFVNALEAADLHDASPAKYW